MSSHTTYSCTEPKLTTISHNIKTNTLTDYRLKTIIFIRISYPPSRSMLSLCWFMLMTC